MGRKNMKFASVAVLSIFIGCIGAQTPTDPTTPATDNSVNLSGTLVDRVCYTSHIQQRQTDAGQNSVTPAVANEVATQCPVNASTAAFGLLTAEGRMLGFDDASNGKIGQMVTSDQTVSDSIAAHRAVKVRIIALPNGDVMVIKEIRADNQ
jgi:hypothetical protein